MRSFFVILLTLLSLVNYAQKTPVFEIPNYAAKSPEAAAFLKYGEYPVDLSTGVPNISLPLYTIEAKGMQIPITLNYHAGGIKVNQEASWVGLGWNLNYGAQIILSVRDGVDEGNGQIDQIPSDASIDYYKQHPHEFAQGPQVSEQWDLSRVKDVYQLSSPTANGQFYIRNAANNDIVVYPPSAFKVEFATKQDAILGARFKVTDAQGNVYLFKTYEKSVREFTHQDFYSSAWYVDQIRTAQNDVIDFSYEDDDELEDYSLTHTINISRNVTNCGCSNQTATKTVNQTPVTSGGSTITYSKKISEILFNTGNSKLVFERQSGRLDLVNGNSRLTAFKVMQKNPASGQFALLKGYAFNYSYFNDNATGTNLYKKKRLKLNGYETLLEGEAHNFVYSDIALPAKDSYAQDTYGYYNGMNNNTNLIPQTVINDPYALTVGSANRDVNPSTNQAGVLREIHYPSKGYTKFNLETNQYYGSTTTSGVATAGCSAWGTGAGNNNPPVYICADEENCCPDPPNCVVINQCNFTSDKISVHAVMNIYNNVQDNDMQIKYQFVRFKVYKNGELQWESGNKNKNATLTADFSIDAGSGYIVAEAWGEHVRGNIEFSYNYSSTVNSNQNSAGLRIASIENYSAPGVLVSKKIYDYSRPDDPVKSSGKRLISGPANYFTSEVTNFTGFSLCPNTIVGDTSSNLLPAVSFSQVYSLTSNTINNMEGNTLTYEYVKESDTNVNDGSANGYTLYKYSFDTDWVIDPSIQVSLPWKRGKLLEKTVFKKGQATYLTKQTNTYMEDQTKVSFIVGFKKIVRKILNLNADNYDFYASSGCGVPDNYFQANMIKKYNYPVYWEYLQSTQITKNIFTDAGQLAGTMVDSKTYTYANPNHLQLSSEVITDSFGQEVETKYFYPGDSEVSTEPIVANLISKNILVPLKTQTFRSGAKLSEIKTQYKNWGTTAAPLFAPEIVQGSKGSSTPESRLRFVNVDPANGNVLQLRQENGMNITYLWGYGGQYPIAKIENATYSSVLSALGTTAAAVINMKVAPSNIRALLPNAMVTTFTYKPLVGVETITDPKNYTLYYDYDGQGRLKSVKEKDEQGNFRILSENEYHYRPN